MSGADKDSKQDSF